MAETVTAPQADYFILNSVVSRMTARITNAPSLPWGADLWIDGAPLRKPIQQPLVYEIEQGDEGEMGAYFRTSAPLMSKDLVKVLQRCGVDNLVLYEAVIRELATGREYADYWAVNLLGLIRGADPAQSVSTSLEGMGNWFSRLVLNDGATRSLLMFRLRENLSKIIVHRRVRDAIEAQPFSLLQFISIDEFSG